MQSFVDVLETRMSALARTVPADGGLKRQPLLDALDLRTADASARAPRGRGFQSSVLAAVTDQRVAVSVQTGRAKTNNEGLLAVLAGADDPTVSWLVLVVADKYKGAATALPVTRDIEALASAVGVDLDLEGVVVLTFGGQPAPVRREVGATAAAPVAAVRGPDGTSVQVARVDRGTEPVVSLPIVVPGIEPGPVERRVAQAVVGSPRFRRQVSAAGRHALDDASAERLIAVLLAGRGKVSRAELAGALDLAPHAASTTVASLRRLMNVEGYDVVAVDLVAVVLDEALMREQFDLRV